MTPYPKRRVRNPEFSPLRFIALSVLLFSLEAPAQTRNSNGFATIQPAAFQAPSLPEIDRAIISAASYLERACGPDGRFVYLVNTDSGQQIDSYNIVRHSGAIYALAMAQRIRSDEHGTDAIVRAASYLRKNYIGPGLHPDQLAVWSNLQSKNSVANLGATGLGLVALAATDKAKPNSVPLEQLQALGRFLLFLQKGDGSFVSKYFAESGPAENFTSLYYPGEAALGFLDLYETDQSPAWLEAAAKALSYLAKSRSGLPEVPPDHWALIATAKLLPHYLQSASPASRMELIQHAMQICAALMKNQLRNPGNQELDGSFDSIGRTAPTATRMEGLLAALEFLPNGNLRDQVKDSVNHGIAFLLRVQLRDGVYRGGVPGTDLHVDPGSSLIRIDFVQHALCAWLRYRELLQNIEPYSRPISGRDPGHIRILFGGDTDFGESYQEQYARMGKGNVLVDKGYDYSVAKLAPLLEGVDYRVLNLETPLTSRRDTSLQGKEYLHFSDPVKAPAALARFGPIAFSLANNHTLDQGPSGLYDTIHSLDAFGARHFGAGEDLTEAEKPLLQTFQIGATSFTIAVFGGLEYNETYEKQYRFYATPNHPGVAPIEASTVAEDIRDLRRTNPNLLVIYFMHTFQNYSWKILDQVVSAKALKEAGVDLVIGAGAHMIQEAEYDSDQWIFYGLGNFIFNAGGRYSSRDALPYSSPLVVDVSVENGKPIASLRLYPIVSDNKITQYQPRLVTEEELSIVQAFLSQKEPWDAATRAAVKQGKDRTGWYLEFTKVDDQGRPALHPQCQHQSESCLTGASTSVHLK